MLSTKTWQRGIVLASGQFTYVQPSLMHISSFADLKADPESRRSREDRRCKAPIHQATPFQGPQIPSTSPRRQIHQQENLYLPPTFNFCMIVCDLAVSASGGEKTELLRL